MFESIFSCTRMSCIQLLENPMQKSSFLRNLLRIPGRGFSEEHISDIEQKVNGLRNKESFHRQLLMQPDSPPASKLCKVAVIGAPNSGKSTLVNRLMGHRISSVSSKVHTTRRLTSNIFINDNTQVVFLDTPGFISPRKRHRHRLDKSLLVDPYSSLILSDLVLVVVDAADPWRRLELSEDVLRALYMYPRPCSALVLNKVDKLRDKELLLEMTWRLTEGEVGGKQIKAFTRGKQRRRLAKNQTRDTEDNASAQQPEASAGEATDVEASNQDEMDDITTTLNINKQRIKEINSRIRGKHGSNKFSRVFMLSALHDDGVADLKRYVLDCAHDSPWQYHSSVLTDQQPSELVELCIRQQLLDHLPNEVPYVIDIDIVLWKESDDGLALFLHLNCPTKRAMAIAMGKGGRMIEKLTECARNDLSELFNCPVNLKLLLRLTASR